MSTRRALFGGLIAPVTGLVVSAAALSFTISRQTPTGEVSGEVSIEGGSRPLSGVRVYLTPADGAAFEPRRAVTDAQGRFRIRRATAGRYNLSASARAHRVDGLQVVVSEGETTRQNLTMSRSQAELAISDHAPSFSTSEEAVIRLKGYASEPGAVGESRVSLKVYRTRLAVVGTQQETLKDLRQMLQSYEKPSDIPASLSEMKIKPQLVRDEPVKLREIDREGFFHQRVKLGRLSPGVYLLRAARGGHTAATALIVTDLALVTKTAPDETLAYTVNMDTGRPISGCTVRVFRGDQSLGTSVTDNNGVARIKLAGNRGDRRIGLIATKDEHEALVGPETYVPESSGRYAVFTTTDRPIYRPGHRVQYKSVLRDVVDPGAVFRVPSGRSVTVEVRDPGGDLVHRKQAAANAMGSVFGEFDLNPEAPAGSYTATVIVDGERHTHDILVAAYRKPEFELTIKPARSRVVRGDTVEAEVSAATYFGAPLSGLTVKYYVVRNVNWRWEFAGDADYDDEEDVGARRAHYGDAFGQMIQESTLELDADGKGRISFPCSIPEDDLAAQAYQFTISANITDEAQRTVSAEATVIGTSAKISITATPQGYLAAPGTPFSLTTSVSSEAGNPLSNRRVEVEYGYEVWHPRVGSGGESRYERAGTASGTTGQDGKASISITPPKEGDLRISVYAADDNGRRARCRSYIWVAKNGGNELSSDIPDLGLATDKRAYSPGDTARVLLNTSHPGHTVLLTVEGDRIYFVRTLQPAGKSTVLELPIEEAWGPNVHLNAILVQKRHYSEASATLRVKVPQRMLNIEIRPDRPPSGPLNLPGYEPREKATYSVQVRDSAGRPVQAEISLGVVDEAIYALREDDPTAIRDAFYPRRYNRVATSCSFNVEYLGDADKSEPKIELRRRFKDTAFWAPVINTDAAGTARVTVELPDNLTTWRTTVLAHTSATTVGRQTAKLVVSKPFLVRLETPRALTQGDETTFTTILHNETDQPRTAYVKLTSAEISIPGADTRRVEMKPHSREAVAWNVSVSTLTDAHVEVKAWTAASRGDQRTDGVAVTIPVRPRGRDLYASASGMMERESITESLRIQPNAVPSLSRLTVRIAPSLVQSIAGGMEYLIGFPYGCVEQTTSRMLPDIYAERVMAGSLSAELRAQLPSMVKNGIARLRRMQNTDGSWGWWMQGGADAWMTAYALHGLNAAAKAGYSVPREVLTRGAQALAKSAAAQTAVDRAFAAWVLAELGDRKAAEGLIAGIKPPAALAQTYAYIALAQQTMRQPASALSQLRSRAITESDTVHWSGSSEGRFYVGDDVEATAVAVKALLAENAQDPLVGPALRWLVRQRRGDAWISTRATSAVLATLADYLITHPGAETAGGEVRVVVNGAPAHTVSLNTVTSREREIALGVPPSMLRTGVNEVRLEHAGSGHPLYTLQLKQTIASDPLPELAGGPVKVQREYRRLAKRSVGGNNWSVQSEAGNGVFRAGENIRVRLTFEVSRDLEHVLIEDPIPAGCAVLETGELEHVDQWGFWWDSIDVRDDRAAFFMRNVRKGRHVLEYNVRAENIGRYRVLPTMMVGMYAPETRSEGAESRLEVR
jgi:uncharacterized protein YfaS (alpha-2-macroglobulin family)